MIEADRIVTAGSRDRDEQLDRAIRPLKLAEYIGQPVVREQMEIPGVPTDVALNDADGQSRIAMPSRDDYGFTEAQADDIAFFVATCSGLDFLDPEDPETADARSFWPPIEAYPSTKHKPEQ